MPDSKLIGHSISVSTENPIFSGNFLMWQCFWNHLVHVIFQFFTTVCTVASVTNRPRGRAGIPGIENKTCFNYWRYNAMALTNMNRGDPTKMPGAELFFLQVRKLHTHSCCVNALHAFSRTKLFVTVFSEDLHQQILEMSNVASRQLFTAQPEGQRLRPLVSVRKVCYPPCANCK